MDLYNYVERSLCFKFKISILCLCVPTRQETDKDGQTISTLA